MGDLNSERLTCARPPIPCSEFIRRSQRLCCCVATRKERERKAEVQKREARVSSIEMRQSPERDREEAIECRPRARAKQRPREVQQARASSPGREQREQKQSPL